MMCVRDRLPWPCPDSDLPSHQPIEERAPPLHRLDVPIGRPAGAVTRCPPPVVREPVGRIESKPSRAPQPRSPAMTKAKPAKDIPPPEASTPPARSLPTGWATCTAEPAPTVEIIRETPAGQIQCSRCYQPTNDILAHYAEAHPYARTSWRRIP